MIFKFRYFLIFFIFILLFTVGYLPLVKNVLADSSGVNLRVTVASCGNGIVDIGEQCDGSNFGGGNCAALGFNGGTLGCSASCQYQTNSCINTAFTASTTQLISFSSGGNFTFTNVLFNFPSNFYTENLKLQAHSYSASSFASEKPAVSGKNFIGQPYDFSFVIPSGSSMNNTISTLSTPVTITMNYSDSDVSGFSESAIAPYRWGAGDSSWQLISGATVDTVNNKVTFSTASFSSFGLFSSAESPAPAPTPSGGSGGSGGGGGGGGDGVITPSGTSNVIFSGRAYPLSTVTLLKDAQVAVSTIAGPDSNFNIFLSGLSAGSYTFSLYGQDKNGLRSALFTFYNILTAGATTNVSGIFIAPTIAIDKSEVKRGDDISIFGQTAPQSDVTIMVSSDEEYLVKTKSDKDGVYLYNFDTSPLDFGNHNTKSKTSLSSFVSTFSNILSFKVGTKNVLAPKLTEKKIIKGDVNIDARVNLIDFSIAAYWYKRSSPPTKVDLNGDGKVDLVDFSIMAYYWTG